jgi:hypothetical protein
VEGVTRDTTHQGVAPSLGAVGAHRFARLAERAGAGILAFAHPGRAMTGGSLGATTRRDSPRARC